MAPEAQQYPLYNTTFSLHRVSPLYTGTTQPLNNTALQVHARRFRDILAGDVLRGVRVGLVPEDDILASVGTLQTVTWQLLPEEEAWSVEEIDLDRDDTTTALTSSRGMIVVVTYEKMAYKAMLLEDDRTSDSETTQGSIAPGMEEFHHFPLLLSKMPGPLRETFTDYLASTFDARVSSLSLSSSFLTEAFEHYISNLSYDEEGDLMDMTGWSGNLRSIIRDTVIFIGFDSPSASLKTIDMSIAREDLPRMVAQGKRIERGSPFYDALAAYIKGHLALDMRHEAVKVVRIACGAFVVGGEGKIKFTQPGLNEDGTSPQTLATRRLVNRLIAIAARGTLTSSKGAT